MDTFSMSMTPSGWALACFRGSRRGRIIQPSPFVFGSIAVHLEQSRYRHRIANQLPRWLHKEDHDENA